LIRRRHASSSGCSSNALSLDSARRPIPWVEEFRPRAVDPERYTSEQDAWKRWHCQQAQDEAEFDQTEADQHESSRSCQIV
jgi:hypothetical protein